MPAELAYSTIGTLIKIHRTDTLDYASAAFVFLLLISFVWYAFRSVHNVRQDGREYIFSPRFLWKVMPFPFAALGVWIFFDSAAGFWFHVAMGLAICALAIGAYPKVIRLDDTGISSKNWLGRPIQIRWDEITRIRRTQSSRYTSQGYQIKSAGGERLWVLDMVYDTDSMIDIMRSKVKIKVDDPQAKVQLEI
jgi:hypothetical protein